MHGYENKAEHSKKLDEHRARKSQLISKLEQLKQGDRDLSQGPGDALRLTREDLRFLRKNLSNSPRSNVETVFTQTAARLSFNALEMLEKTTLIRSFLEADESQTAASALRQIRNDLSHGNKGYDVTQIAEVVDILEHMVRANALRILGCPESVIDRASPVHNR